MMERRRDRATVVRPMLRHKYNFGAILISLLILRRTFVFTTARDVKYGSRMACRFLLVTGQNVRAPINDASTRLPRRTIGGMIAHRSRDFAPSPVRITEGEAYGDAWRIERITWYDNYSCKPRTLTQHLDSLSYQSISSAPDKRLMG
jgi:hypothetical protein